MKPLAASAVPSPAVPSPATAKSRRRVFDLALRGIAALIIGQTLFFKFQGAPEPVYIFTKLGAEPVGRILTAVFESIAVLLLVVPRTAVLGALLSAGLMLGAIAAHLGPLGIEVLGDGGLLFVLALVTLGASGGILLLRFEEALALVRAVIRRRFR